MNLSKLAEISEGKLFGEKFDIFFELKGRSARKVINQTNALLKRP